MCFPIEPQPHEIDERGLFSIQDQRLLSCVLPLFSFLRDRDDDQLRGHGTAFRFDLWSRCLTAFHVIDDLFEFNATTNQPELKSDVRLIALEWSGLVYGTVRIPQSSWRPMADCGAVASLESLPFQTTRLRNLTELAVLRIRPSSPTSTGTSFLPLDLGHWKPRIGERVLALGFADLDVSEVRVVSQSLYGSMGEIIDIERADASRGRPWPMIRVSANWPGGMSGGPIFNEAGNVIGIVSSGIVGDNVGTATFFSGWEMPRQILRSVDPNNPGWFFCHVVFSTAGDLVFATQDETEARRFAAEKSLSDIGIATVNPRTGDYVRS